MITGANWFWAILLTGIMLISAAKERATGDRYVSAMLVLIPAAFWTAAAIEWARSG